MNSEAPHDLDSRISSAPSLRSDAELQGASSLNEVEILQSTHDQTVAFFSDLSAKHGISPAGVGWSTRSQIRRFEEVLKLGPLQGSTLLDVGCGYGDLFRFLKDKGIQVDYTGYDITAAMITIAKHQHPEIADRFHLVDILTEDIIERYDYIVANGVLNLIYGNNVAVMARLIQRIYEACTIGILVTMTSALTQRPKQGIFYYDPVEILCRISPLCQNLVLDHSYLPHDFALFCYRKSLYD
ncbi:MAG: class I SAM-dependent methyltransferase [Nitrospirae bacterium]|nr:class I SAM-dependent methyltransferase [Nitrospirota bacterium]